MRITDVKVRVISENDTEKLRGFATITLDEEFVVRDLKIIEGHQGLFVAMPSRKMTDRCPKCGTKNALRSNFCNECGGRMPESQFQTGPDGRAKLHVDVAHPVTQHCRDMIHKAIVEEYNREVAAMQSKSSSVRQSSHES